MNQKQKTEWSDLVFGVLPSRETVRTSTYMRFTDLVNHQRRFINERQKQEPGRYDDLPRPDDMDPQLRIRPNRRTGSTS